MPKSSVMNNSSAADVNAVMGVAATGRDEVRAQGRFLVAPEKHIVLSKSTEVLHDAFLSPSALDS